MPRKRPLHTQPQGRQPSLFDEPVMGASPLPKKSAREVQKEMLASVSSRIGSAIVSYCAARGVGATFHADDLRAHVAAVTGPTAPGSADRILRDLRKRKALDYEVVSRRNSLYRVLGVSS